MANPNPVMTPEFKAMMGNGRHTFKGRLPGVKNKKKVTSAQLTQELRDLMKDTDAHSKVFNFLLGVLDNDKVRNSEKVKAAQILLTKFITDANVDSLIDSKPVIESPEEALAILNGLHNEIE